MSLLLRHNLKAEQYFSSTYSRPRPKRKRKSKSKRGREERSNMENIEHTTAPTNGINLHIASIGTGPVVLFLHGFPELWYSWRHQLLSLSSLGYRCIAPDLRGYGDTDAPPSVCVLLRLTHRRRPRWPS